MTFRELALKNIKGHWHQYIAFFFSCTFSVMIFTMFASFIFNPDVVNGHIQGERGVRNGLLACEYIIFIFSFFFVLYSISAFIKSRKKEFGLFSLFGMTRFQIQKLVLQEHMIIGVISIGSGLILGLLFSKLFIMVISYLLKLDTPIHFRIVPESIFVTIIGFLMLFGFVTLLQVLRVGKSEIIELLKASREPKSLPLYSKGLVTLSAITLLGGYGLAYFSTLKNFGNLMFPVLGLVIIGSYFLFTQGSVALLRRLQNQPNLYYKKTNLLSISQFIFKMKDNARMLFMVTILSAVVLTAAGTLYIFYKGILYNVSGAYPRTFSFIERGAQIQSSNVPDRVTHLLNTSGAVVTDRIHLKGFLGKLKVTSKGPGFNPDAFVVSESTYNQEIRKLPGMSTVKLENGTALLSYSGPNIIQGFQKGEKASIQLDEKSLPLHLSKQQTLKNGLLNLGGTAFGTLVLSDQDYKQLSQGLTDAQRMEAFGYDLKNWKKTEPIIKKIKSVMPSGERMTFETRVDNYIIAEQLASLTLLIGVFVSLLFFIAAGSMIYFKLFTELDEDYAQLQALKRIGVTDEEMKRMLTRQIALIFFIPFAVGAVHTAFAFKMLQNIQVFGIIWGYGGIVIGIFFLIQLIFFLVTRKTYISRLLK